MRILISGGGDVGRITAETLVHVGHDVVLVEENRKVCETLAEELDIMVICGDATNPEILEKAEIDKADVVLALAGSDKMNILTALLAKDYGIKRIIVKLDDPAFNPVCQRFGVEEIINPKIATAKHIADMVRRPHAIDVATLVGGSIRVFNAVIHKEEHVGKRIEDLKLTPESLAVVIKRENEFFIPVAGFKLLKGDQLTLLVEEKNIEKLKSIFE